MPQRTPMPHTTLATEPSRSKNAEDIDKAYNTSGFFYDMRGLFILTISYRNTLLKQIRFFAANISDHHLEVAVGSGSLFQLLLMYLKLTFRPVKKCVGIDYARNMLIDARKRFAKKPHIEIHHMDAANLTFADQCFNSINIANAVHCLPDIDGSMREAYRVLSNQGTMRINVLSHPSGWPILRRWATKVNQFGLKQGILYKLYTEEDIKAILEATGFILSHFSKSGNCFYIEAKKQ